MSNRTAESQIYRSLIVDQAPRVLGLVDRSLLSPTAGCCDRTFWAWKFVDFPRSRFQEATCALAYLHSGDLDAPEYSGNPRLLGWIENGLRYWCSLQHRDGSFDEAYPYERSLAATAFTMFYVGEAMSLLGPQISRSLSEELKVTMAAAGRWLSRNDETHGFLSNHLAAAAAALYHAHGVTGEDSLRQRARYFINRILRHQSEEGWYEEYGGADPGYQTHGSFYLARCSQLDPDSGLQASLARSVAFLAHFVHPDGSLGGEYASRNTQTYYPAAFEMMAAEEPVAAWIAATMRPSVESAAAAGLRSTDAYNYFPFLNNMVFAHKACLRGGRAADCHEPSSEPGLVWFPRAGIARLRTPHYDAYVGASKGGVVKLFDRRKRSLAFNDCGYIGRLKRGGQVSTQQQDGARVEGVSDERMNIEGGLFQVSRPVMDPWRFVAFRIFSLTFGRAPRISRWLKRYLVRVLIQRRRALRVHFRRTIEFRRDGLTVTDRLEGPDGEQIESLQWGEAFTTIHMGSSRYFVPNELNLPVIAADEVEDIDPGRIASGLQLTRRVVIDVSPEDEDSAST